MIPWPAKIAAKIVLSRIPANYRLWQKMGLFKHGYMEKPEYAYAVFKQHFDRVDFANKRGGFVALELGPGDSLFSALVAVAFGAKSTHLVDTARYARDDIAPYREMARYLRGRGYSMPEVANIAELDELLQVFGSHYWTQGLTSLQEIPSQSVDFVWSQAVLEHVRRQQMPGILRELRRVLRDDGVASHRIDLMDHLGGSLNNLRFSGKLWESRFFADSGFYTNRFRYRELCNLFEAAGFAVDVLGTDRWDHLPTPRSQLAAEFVSLPEEELLVSGFDVILRPR